IASAKICFFLSAAENIIILAGISPAEIRESLSPLIDLEAVKGIKLALHAASMRIFGGYYGAVKKEIESLINAKAGNIATVKAFGRQYVRNCIKNMRGLAEALPVSGLFGKFKNVPAIVLASGPSLESSMDAVRNARESVFIIASDSALAVCKAFGFRPDFVVSVDPQAYISEHLLGFWEEPLRIVTSISAWPCSLKASPGAWKIYCSLNSHPFAQLIDELMPGTIGSVNSRTGSVAGDALLFASRCGFSPVACAGFDFGFSSGVIYPRGTAYQRRYAEIFMNRLRVPETFNMDYIMKSSNALRENGRFTRRSFLQFQKNINDVTAKLSGTVLFHINPPNAPMAGSKAAPCSWLDNREKKDKAALLAEAELNIRRAGENAAFIKLVEIAARDEIFRELIVNSCGERDETRIALYKKFFRQMTM
ncbi:MAG: DUF115 domain-containing protein, partial [Spirochaetia bacterium]|nr:DUF115 domain-containing protein [Spirochaetia bacterium]